MFPLFETVPGYSLVLPGSNVIGEFVQYLNRVFLIPVPPGEHLVYFSTYQSILLAASPLCFQGAAVALWCVSTGQARHWGGGEMGEGDGGPAGLRMQQEINDKGEGSKVTARHGSCYGRGVETSCVWFQVDEAVM